MINLRTSVPKGLLALLVALFLTLGLPAADATFAVSAFGEDEEPAPEPMEGEEPAEEEEEEEAVEVPWVVDIDEAIKQAKAEGKDLFINFTGSDWCGWCHKLEGEVFGHAEFVDAASKDFVFLFLDFPKAQELKDKVVDAERNEEWKTNFGVAGFPTIILATADGHPYARSGYQEGGPAPYLELLTELKAGGEKVKKLIADEKHEDVEALKAAFPVLAEGQFLAYPAYAWTLDAVEKLDPKGELELLPFVTAERERLLMVEEEKSLMALFPKERGQEPDREAIANFVIESKYLKGGRFLNLCFGLADWMLGQGENGELAQKLLERAAKDPLTQEHPQAKNVLEQFNKRVEEALNPPADEDPEGHEDGEDEDEEDHEDDDDEGHDK